MLEQTISEQVIDWSIANLKLGKSLGLDRLTGGFYKTFKDQVILYLRNLFKYCIRAGRTLDT